MGKQEAKYCLDQKHIKWSLVEGVITRKGAEDGPDDGQVLPVSQIEAIEKAHVHVTHRSPLGWPVTIVGLVIAGLSLLIGSFSWLLAAPWIVFGLMAFVWGLKRIPAQTETIGAFRIVAKVQNPDDWILAGEVPEVQGFVDGIKSDMAQTDRHAQPA